MAESAYFLALFSGFFFLAAAFPLTEALVCNRFLLFALFGIFQLGSLGVRIPMYIGYEITGVFSAWSDRLLGSLEILTVATIWIAFFPPALYRRWTGRTAMVETGGED